MILAFEPGASMLSVVPVVLATWALLWLIAALVDHLPESPPPENPPETLEIPPPKVIIRHGRDTRWG